jgi:thiamine biosynthesis lipoprotein ApbE
VVTSGGKSADGLGAGMCVLGPERGLPLIDKTEGAGALYMIADGKTVTFHASKRFDRFESK